MSKPITHHEALIYVMVTMSAVDSKMSELELLRIGDMVKRLPVFDGFDTEDLVAVSTKCGEVLQGENSLHDVLHAIAEGLPLHLYDTAYALAIEVAAADFDVKPEELRFLEMLRDRLDLDKLSVAAIEYTARARYRKA